MSKQFKNRLLEWGCDKEIIVETTVVDDNLVSGTKKSCNKIRLLFFSRVESYKGIYQTIDAFELLYKNYKNIELHIAGSGTELDSVKERVETLKTENIFIHGYISGVQKKTLLEQTHILIFPSLSEGMPNAVLECMAQGLAIVTTRVGGVTDFFVDERHGYFLNSITAEEITKQVIKLIENIDRLKNISMYNSHYAQKRFLASKVVSRLNSYTEKFH